MRPQLLETPSPIWFLLNLLVQFQNPDSPLNVLEVYSDETGTFQVSFNMPLGNGGEITNYIVQTRVVGGTWGNSQTIPKRLNSQFPSLDHWITKLELDRKIRRIAASP